MAQPILSSTNKASDAMQGGDPPAYACTRKSDLADWTPIRTYWPFEPLRTAVAKRKLQYTANCLGQ